MKKIICDFCGKGIEDEKEDWFKIINQRAIESSKCKTVSQDACEGCRKKISLLISVYKRAKSLYEVATIFAIKSSRLTANDAKTKDRLDDRLAAELITYILEQGLSLPLETLTEKEISYIKEKYKQTPSMVIIKQLAKEFDISQKRIQWYL